MSGERTEARLDAMLAALRRGPGHLDEITRARVGARLEAAFAKIDDAAAARGARGGRRRGIAAGVGLAAAAAAAVVAVVAAARGGGTADDEVAATAELDLPRGSAAADAVEPSAASTGAAPGSAAGAGAGRAPHAEGSSAAPDGGAAPITVAADESAQLTLGSTAIVVYGPGRLSPTREGAIVEAAGLVVDRARGDAPWSLRYHGVEIVATRATFAVDRVGGTRVTVMRGELELRCVSGLRTVRSGESATCEPAAKARVAPAPRPPARAAARPRGPDSQAPAAQAPDSQVPLDPQAPDSQVPLDPQAPGSQLPSSQPPPEPPPRREPTADRYSAAEQAMRRGELDTARDALLAIIDAAPASLNAATALLDLARLSARRGDPAAARGYLDRLDRHPHRAALAAPAARLLGTLARGTTLRAR